MSDMTDMLQVTEICRPGYIVEDCNVSVHHLTKLRDVESHWRH